MTNIIKDFTRDDFITLLYSLGFITINDKIFGDTEFIIPNHTIEGLYFDYFKIEVENRNEIKFKDVNIKKAIRELALNKNTKLLQDEIQEVIHLLSNRDFMKFDEKYLKIITLMILNISKFYYIKSEPEYNHKYPDIMLLKQEPFKTTFQFLFELKWAKKSITGDWKAKRKEGIEQIKGYLKLKDIKEIEKISPLFSYLIIANGEKVEILEVNS